MGQTLDKGGRGVRGTLYHQNFSALKNGIPFSDTAQLTSPQDAVSGRDLLEKYLGVPENIPGLFNSPTDAFFDVAGFGLEVLTDPLTLISGPLGSLTKAGQSATKAIKGADAAADALRLATKTGKAVSDPKAFKEATELFTTSVAAARQGGKLTPAMIERGGHVLPRTPFALGEQVRQGLRGAIGIKAHPFAKHPFVTFGAGSERIAGFIDKFSYGKASPVPALRALFSSATGDIQKGLAQRGRDKAMAEMSMIKDAAAAMETTLMSEHTAMGQRFAEAAQAAGKTMDIEDFNKLTRMAVDAQKQNFNVAGIRKLMEDVADKDLGAEGADLAEGLMTYLEFLKTSSDNIYTRVRDLGDNNPLMGGPKGKYFDFFADHFERRTTDAAVRAKKVTKGRKAGTDYEQRRDVLYRNFPRSTVGINNAMRNERVTATGKILKGGADAVKKRGELSKEQGIRRKCFI